MAPKKNRPTITRLAGQILRRLEDELPEQETQFFEVKSIRFKPRRVGAVGAVGPANPMGPANPVEPVGPDLPPELPTDLPEEMAELMLGWDCDEFILTETANGGYTLECVVYPRDAQGNIIEEPATTDAQGPR